MISPSQRPLPDNTQHSQQTNIHTPGGIRTHDRSRRAVVDLRLRQRGYWDRQDLISPVIDNYFKCHFIFVNIPHRIHKCTNTLYDYAIINY